MINEYFIFYIKEQERIYYVLFFFNYHLFDLFVVLGWRFFGDTFIVQSC